MYKKAFTLLEILLVVAVLGVLITMILFFIDPEDQFTEVDDAKRRADVLNIYNAINQYRYDNRGALPEGLGYSYVEICQPGCEESTSQIDISEELTAYIRSGEIPIDPAEVGGELTGYKVKLDTNNRIVVSVSNNESINTSESN
ncbi:MAG: hypothetical protein RLZZ223_474 [Candidatus Parcubacteria bacterium]|jgi:prepilin-type N-terminal cleavage/methylation domain-containing protein